MEQRFARRFDDVRQERSVIFLLWLTDKDILDRNNFNDHEKK